MALLWLSHGYIVLPHRYRIGRPSAVLGPPLDLEDLG